MKKVLNVLIVLMLSLGVLYPLDTYAKLNSIKNDEDYVIPSDYAFTPKFINGVTKIEISDTYNKTDLHNNTDYRNIYRAKDYHNYWAIYRNVGIWKQHIVDMKIMVDDVVDTNSTKKCTSFGNIADEDVIGLVFHTERIGLGVNSECRNEGTMAFFKIEFFDGKTGEELSDIKTTLTYTDIDYDERILLDNINTKEANYYEKYGVEHLDLIDDNYRDRYTFFLGNMKWTCKFDGWPGDVECLDPTRVEPGSCDNNDCTGCYKAGMIVTLNEGSFTVGWAGQGIVFSSPSFFRIADSNSIKTVDKDQVKPGEELNYKIEQYVPNQSSNQHYKLWKITDKLENILETSVDNIKVTSNEGEDITGKFNIAIENNTLTVSAKEDYLASDEFYNRTFFIDIKTKVGNDIKNVKEITNNAILDVQYGNESYSEDIPSNPVKTKIDVEEVSIPNTGKFTSMLIIFSGIIFIISGIIILSRMKKNKLSA